MQEKGGLGEKEKHNLNSFGGRIRNGTYDTYIHVYIMEDNTITFWNDNVSMKKKGNACTDLEQGNIVLQKKLPVL